MIVYLLKKLAKSVNMVIAVTMVTFGLTYGNGPGIARAVLGTTATEEAVQIELVKLGLDRPFFVQYGEWLSHAVTGNLGSSFFTSQPVTSALNLRVPVTLALLIITLIFTALLSVLIGVAAGVYGGWLDRALQFISVLGAAIPGYVVAIGLVFALAVSIPVFPATGYVSPSVDVGRWAASLTLPGLALIVGSVAAAASQFRGEVVDNLSRDYVRTLRARGIPDREVIFRNVLRNSASAGLTVLSLQAIYVLGGVVFIEQIFALPGMGSLTNTAAQQGDVPVVMGCVLITILIVVVVNFLADIANVALNPKVRTA